jgi:uncharacterized protein (TIGR03437 family)
MSADITDEAVRKGSSADADHRLICPAPTRFPKWVNLLQLIFAIISIALTSGRAQGPSVMPDARSALPACEQNLAQQVAVAGLNPAWEHLHPLSSAVIPSVGFATADMASAIDATVGNFMNMNGLPGGAVAITYKDQLIFAKSYGYVDVDNSLFTEPDSRFRVASVSKAITAMGILKLVHDGQLSLDDRPFPFPGVGSVIGGAYNTALSPPFGPTVDEMLHHAGGWDRDTGPDLMGYDTLHTVEGLIPSSSAPPDCTNLLRYVESQRLQFRPGTKVDYSNVGFCALSEVIRETSGTSYFDYLQKNVLSPLGMNDTTLGSTQQSQQQDREAVYYDTTDPSLPSLFAPYATVPPPYSSIGSLEAQQGGGGLVSTAIDLAHFTGAIASGKLPNFPGPPTFPGWPQMYYTLSTRIPSYEGPDTAVGAGWDAVPSNVVAVPLLPYDNYNFVKEGGYQGTVSSVAATGDGYGFAAVFNGGDNTAPGPDSQIFWPGCSSPAPLPAAKSGNCALQAAYNHATKQPWNMDFSPQYSQAFSDWMDSPQFASHLAAQQSSGNYPWRLEGRSVVNQASSGGSATVFQYRGRFAPPPGSVAGAGGLTTTPPQFLYGQSCSAVLSALQSASTSTPLMSLQRFYDAGSKSYLYQAVWSAALPTHFAVSVPGSAKTGAAFNLTVTALDSSNQTVTGYSGSVRFASTDKAGVLPLESKLSEGMGTFSATLETAGNETITATDNENALTGTSAPITATVLPPGSPMITLVANAEGERTTIAPNTWVEVKGLSLAHAGDSRIWKASDFVNNQMPTDLDGVSVTVNGQSAYVYYISPTQVNILTPSDALPGSVMVQVTNNGAFSPGFKVSAQMLSPSFFLFNGGPYVAATHLNGTLIGPATLYPGATTPAKPNETVVLYANGFGSTSAPVVSGSVTQSGTLTPLPVVKIGGITANVQFAGLNAPGEFQFNVTVPAGLANGDQAITASYGGQTTQAGTLITIQN